MPFYIAGSNEPYSFKFTEDDKHFEFTPDRIENLRVGTDNPDARFWEVAGFAAHFRKQRGVDHVTFTQMINVGATDSLQYITLTFRLTSVEGVELERELDKLLA